jgi:hypothetical protein
VLASRNFLADYFAVIRDVRNELKSGHEVEYVKELRSIVSKLFCDDRRTILRGKDTGQWLSVLPSAVNGTKLSAQEFRDSLLLCYSRSPAAFPSHCDGCGQNFTVRHTLECKKGGLVISCHNEIQDELSDLASNAIIPSAVHDEPLIHNSRTTVGMTASEELSPQVNRNLHKNKGEDRRDVLIHGFWARGTDCIIDVRITHTDTKSNRSKDPYKVLEAHERGKKRKYLEPFIVSTDGLFIGREAKTMLKKMSALLAEKSRKFYSQVCG